MNGETCFKTKEINDYKWYLVRRNYREKYWHMATDNALGSNFYGKYIPDDDGSI